MEKYVFSMNSIVACGMSDGKIPNKLNDNMYLTNEEFKTFKSSSIRQFTRSNKRFMFPLWMWLMFSIVKKVKFGTAIDIKILLDNQLKLLVRNISTLNRNGICGDYENVTNIHEKCKKIENEFDKVNVSGCVSLYSFFEKYPSKKKNVLETITELSLMVYKNDKYEFSHDLNNLAKIKNKINEMINNNEDQDSFLLDILLNSKISLKEKKVSKNADEYNEYSELKKVIDGSIVKITTNEIHKTFKSMFGVEKRWKLADVINYQLLNRVEDVVFGIDKKLNIVSIHVDVENTSGIFDFKSDSKLEKRHRRGSKRNASQMLEEQYVVNELVEEIQVNDFLPFVNIEDIQINFTFDNRFTL
jgi:hypothetical protein